MRFKVAISFYLFRDIFFFNRGSSAEKTVGCYDPSPWHAFGSAYLLTLTNPATILSFMAIFAELGLGTASSDYISAIVLVLGITLGSAIWWFILSGGIAYILHHRLTPRLMQAINRFSGIIIFIFGVFALSMK